MNLNGYYVFTEKNISIVLEKLFQESENEPYALIIYNFIVFYEIKNKS